MERGGLSSTKKEELWGRNSRWWWWKNEAFRKGKEDTSTKGKEKNSPFTMCEVSRSNNGFNETSIFLFTSSHKGKNGFQNISQCTRKMRKVWFFIALSCICLLKYIRPPKFNIAFSKTSQVNEIKTTHIILAASFFFPPLWRFSLVFIYSEMISSYKKAMIYVEKAIFFLRATAQAWPRNSPFFVRTNQVRCSDLRCGKKPK